MSVKAAISKLNPKSIDIPKLNGHPTSNGVGRQTPKTPQDEALAFFSSDKAHEGEPIQVWELSLEDDGGPGESKSVCHDLENVFSCQIRAQSMQYIRLPPPTRPYVLRLSLRPGTPCTRNGVLKSDFPMDGGVFKRGDWKERKLPSDVSK